MPQDDLLILTGTTSLELSARGAGSDVRSWAAEQVGNTGAQLFVNNIAEPGNVDTIINLNRGNVGIGTDRPLLKLHVIGGVFVGVPEDQQSGGMLVRGDIACTRLFAAFKEFVIDHPLDPENRSLAHASVESSEMANVYSGNAHLDDNGEAWVELPAWLEALNADFRYQLTCIGQFAPVYIAEELANNRFKIGGGKAGMKVSWQLIGIRKDPLAQAHPLIVEEEKAANERGYYLYPEVYNQPGEMAIYRIRYADMTSTPSQ